MAIGNGQLARLEHLWLDWSTFGMYAYAQQHACMHKTMHSTKTCTKTCMHAQNYAQTHACMHAYAQKHASMHNHVHKIRLGSGGRSLGAGLGAWSEAPFLPHSPVESSARG